MAVPTKIMGSETAIGFERWFIKWVTSRVSWLALDPNHGPYAERVGCMPDQANPQGGPSRLDGISIDLGKEAGASDNQVRITVPFQIADGEGPPISGVHQVPHGICHVLESEILRIPEHPCALQDKGVVASQIPVIPVGDNPVLPTVPIQVEQGHSPRGFIEVFLLNFIGLDPTGVRNFKQAPVRGSLKNAVADSEGRHQVEEAVVVQVSHADRHGAGQGRGPNETSGSSL